MKYPMDGRQNEKTGKGYCFINFRHVLYVLDFIKDKQCFKWPKYGSDKIIDICYAKEQMAKKQEMAQDYKMTDSEREELL